MTNASLSGRRALLIIDEGAAIHNRALLDQLADEVELSTIIVPTISRIPGRGQLLVRELILLAKRDLWKSSYGRDGVIVAGSGHYAVLAAARLLRAIGRRTPVFVYNFYLHDLGQRRVVRRILASLLTGDTAVVAQSQTDVEYFKSVSADATLFLVPYGQDPVDAVRPEDVSLGDYVFSGGYSNRDYDLVVRCAGCLPNIKFVIACSQLNRLPASIPDNVDVLRDLESRRFHQLMAGARIVVVPLAADVGASGQMVTLAAMQLGKVAIVPDLSVTAQYVDPGVNGLTYAHGSLASLRGVITDVFDDTEALTRLGQRAHATYAQRFTLAAFTRALLRCLRDFVAGRPDARAA